MTPPRDARRAEIAVIGSGPGGAVAAALLAEAGRGVLIIEEGQALGQDSCPPFSLDELRQKYRSGGVTAALGKTAVAYVEGRVVGGGSEINAGHYHRAPTHVLERWARDFKLAEAGENDLKPHFEACEKDLEIGPAQDALSKAERKLADGAAALGLSTTRAWRIGRHLPGKTPSWARAPMSQSYLPRALAAGARLMSETRVLSLARESGRWQLRAAGPSGPFTIEADYVFLACGAIQTPLLLRRSGLRGGRQLALHPMLKAVAEFDGEIHERGLPLGAVQVKDAGRGFTLGSSADTPSNIAINMAGRGPEAMAHWPRMGAYYSEAGLFDAAGSVGPVPGFQDALVRYKISQDDNAALVDGFRVLTKALLAAGARAVYPAIAKAAPIRSEKDLESVLSAANPRAFKLTSVHLMASCPMGETENAPLDSFGRVRGAEGLVVCDASAFCGAVGVNPQGTIMALSRRNALAFLNRL